MSEISSQDSLQSTKIFARKSHTSRSLPLTEGEQILEQRPDVERVEKYICDDSVYMQYWKAAKELDCGKVIIFVAGMGDYGGRFAHRAQVYLDAGFTVVAYDHPGTGRSDGLHGYIESMDVLTNTLHHVFLETIKDLPDRKYYLLSASMGGLISLLYTLKRKELIPVSSADLSGMVLLCPLIRSHPASTPNSVLKYAAYVLRYLAPTLAASPANKGKNHVDPSVEERFKADVGTYTGWLRVGTGMSLLEGMTELQSKLEDIDVPFLACHGLNDLVTDVEGSKELVRRCARLSDAQKSIILYENGDHVLWIGAGERCLQDSLNWFQQK
ncbi:hypothetical protein MIR68_003889 [Amoeboaphelidium protococcarum]|nr:hypothetical protein MIR68_003889 [Amoeboaphelidium protococcarum]